jgi:FtsP/CotA-like multicopper oxidase with cupredoxin domain
MSILGRRVSVRAVVIVVVMMIVGALLPVLSKTPSRDVYLVVRGMAFYLEGDLDTPNPTIHVTAGETVRVVLRNQDRGMTHDFTVPALGEGVDPIEWNERAEVTFDVPKTPGTYEYLCRPHMLMMKGTIVIE